MIAWLFMTIIIFRYSPRLPSRLYIVYCSAYCQVCKSLIHGLLYALGLFNNKRGAVSFPSVYGRLWIHSVTRILPVMLNVPRSVFTCVHVWTPFRTVWGFECIAHFIDEIQRNMPLDEACSGPATFTFPSAHPPICPSARLDRALWQEELALRRTVKIPNIREAH